MARIVDTGIAVTGSNAIHVTMLFGVDVSFTAAEIAEGRSGAATYSVFLMIWDEDTVFDDRIVSAGRDIAPADMKARVGIDFPAELEFANLRRKEPLIESLLGGGIEIFGEFTVRKNNRAIAPSVRSRPLSVPFPLPLPPFLHRPAP